MLLQIFVTHIRGRALRWHVAVNTILLLFVDQAEQLEAEKEDTIKRAGELRELLTKLEDEQNRMEAQKTDLIAEKDKLLSEKSKY